MPKLDINGQKVTVGEEFLSLSPEEQDAAVEEIAQSLGEPQPAEFMRSGEADEQLGGRQPGGRDGEGVFEKIDAGVRGAADMLTLGLSDEIAAGLGTGFGMLGDYDEALAKQRGIDRFDEQENPYARIAGQVAGGVTGGVGMAKSGATLMGRAVPGATSVAPKATQTALAAAEGAGYGGAYGVGSGEGVEDRLRQGKVGALTGAATGAFMQKVANGLANRAARKASMNAATPTDVLEQSKNALYRQSEQAGVTIKQSSLQGLAKNMKIAAGRLNDKIRPQTAGVVEDIDDLFSKNMSLEEFDEVRQQVGLALKSASPSDGRTLSAMKRVMDKWADNIKPQSITGDIRGFEYIKQARALNTRKMKTELLESILDDAQVQTGNYTQAGLAKTVQGKFKALYSQIKKGKHPSFTKEEIALIRQIASSSTSGKTMRLLAKFDPKGVVSLGGGMLVGSAVPGVGTVGLPLAGLAAARGVEKNAVNAVQNLRNAAAAGAKPYGQQIGNAAPALLPAAAGSSQLANSRRGRLPRQR